MAVKEAITLLESLDDKMHWEQLKALLKRHNYKVLKGSINTLASLKDFLRKESNAQTFIQIFREYYYEVLVGGQKTIQIYRLPSDFSQTHIFKKNTFKESSISCKLAKEYFPYVIPNDLVKETSEVELINIENKGTKQFFYFSSIKSITEKKEVIPKEYEDNEQTEIASFLKKYKKVTVFEERLKQYIDVVCLDYSDNTLDIRLDSDLISGQKDLDLAFKCIKEAFIGMYQLSTSNAFSNPFNFFPLIENLYLSEKYRVCELTFCTDEGYVHNERNRSKQKGGDVRNGSFHIGGRDNCNDLRPYKISIRWDSELKKDDKIENSDPTEVELSLNSALAEISKKGGGTLFSAVMTSSPLKSDQDDFFNILKGV
ncbi:hypothetical protein MTF64_04675 [Pseudoalteromonas sp. 2CM41L]|uniref:hypothetical protein n=1 Tax=Pseudoalteromonas sp. 2CM41L TaxID=2929857 RepID=UPI0020BEC539|nr:hypothetical protein [Pseudoalteromonas sp. 2CM41L]MCK8106165.1 hypothetical protein [Pseudoalteromonas sp. 2CM41L]